MDRDQCWQILEDDVVGPNALYLICASWDNVVFVCCASGYYGAPFSAKHGVTQGSVKVGAHHGDIGINVADICITAMVFHAKHWQ